MGSNRLVVPLALLALAAGCSGPRHAAPSAGVPTATTSAAPLIADGEPCSPAPGFLGLSSRAGCVSITRGIFERDHGSQELIVYALLDPDGFPIEWRVMLRDPDGEFVDERLPAGSATSNPSVLGAADADRDGVDEAFVRIVTHSYHSGATHEIGIFGVRRGDLFRVRADGAPLRFPVGGVSTFGEGAECRDVDLDGDAEFILLRVDYVFGETQRWSERVYEWTDRSLTFVRREEGRMAKTGYSDPLLYRYYSLRCFDFEPPFPYARG
jgi:hypothetical protein